VLGHGRLKKNASSRQQRMKKKLEMIAHTRRDDVTLMLGLRPVEGS
jgi:hypothetical protein